MKVFQLVHRLQIRKEVLRCFKIWQSDILRQDLKVVCQQIGRSILEQKGLVLKNIYFKKRLRLAVAFGNWLKQVKAPAKSIKQFLIMSENKVSKLMKVCKIAILRGKTAKTHLHVHLNLLQQMYIFSLQNESLSKPQITLVSQSHKSIIR